MYERQSRLSDRKQELLIEHFVAFAPVRKAAELVGVHRNTAASFYTRLRKVIAEETEKEMETYFPVGGDIEVYVADFLGKYNSRWFVGSEVLVFSLFQRGGKVYSEVIPNNQPATLMSITERLVKPGSDVYTDGFSKWDVLNDSDFHHVRPKYLEEDLWLNDNLLGITGFWTRVFGSWFAQFRGIPIQSFHLFLKVFEWRNNGLFNSGEEDLEKGREALTSQLKAWVRMRQNRT